MGKLVVITSEPNYSIIKFEENFKSTNKPFTRQNLILNKLKKDFSQEKFIIQTDSIDEIESKIIKLGSNDTEYLEFLKNAFKSFIGSPDYDNNEYESPYDCGLVNYLFGRISHAHCISKKNLAKIPYYLQCGLYGNDFCTSIFDYTYETAMRSANNGLVAADIVAADIVNADIVNADIVNTFKQSVIYCLNVFPGHHATRSLYSGYCFMNNAAICAESLLSTYTKITILDLDYHHGDGTQKIFYDNKRVLTISIHADPTNNFPFYTGFDDEIGIENGEYFNHNYPLPNINDTVYDQYKPVLLDALDQIIKFNTEVLIIAFGADTFEKDPQGGFNLKLEDYQKIGQFIGSTIKTPIIITQEGGYYLDKVDEIVFNFISGLLDESGPQS